MSHLVEFALQGFDPVADPPPLQLELGLATASSTAQASSRGTAPAPLPAENTPMLMIICLCVSWGEKGRHQSVMSYERVLQIRLQNRRKQGCTEEDGMQHLLPDPSGAKLQDVCLSHFSS